MRTLSCAANLLYPEEAIARPYNMVWGSGMYRIRRILVALFVTSLLGACAETTFLAHATKVIQERSGSGNPAAIGNYKIGNPYQINGVWYYPKIDYNYVETGIASWYGPKFHNKKTANGEIFDMNTVSAAHRTLPMPSLARVTNLNTGRAINVRINDRGPFAHGRIIDLSRRAAQLLGFERAGTSLVRVEILSEESRQMAYRAQNFRGVIASLEPNRPESAPTVSVISSTLPPPAGAKVLFDGSSVAKFNNGKLTEGKLLAATNVESKAKFKDHSFHIEFRTPFMPKARGQGRGNSGVYVQSRYEVQVLDSFGLDGKDNECGGIYQVSKPIVNMCLPPLAWQTYDIDFTAAKYDKDGKKTANARVTVKHNGVTIHDDLELPKQTPGRHAEGPTADSLFMQDHSNPVAFRNIWVVEK